VLDSETIDEGVDQSDDKHDHQDDVVQDLGAAVTLLIVHIDHCD